MSTTASSTTRRPVITAAVPALLAGILSGGLAVVFAVSFAALVFGGVLAEFLPLAIAMALWGASLHAVMVAFLGSHPGSMAGVSSEIAIVAVVVAGVAALPALATDPTTLLATVIVIVALAAAVTGVICLVLGHARAGNLVRYVPYPAMGGFVAGVGWLLLEGGFHLAMGAGAESLSPARLLEPGVALWWAPPALAAVVLVVQQRVHRHFLGVPVVLLLMGVGFFAVAALHGETPASLAAAGWLLGPFPEQTGPVLPPLEALIDALGDARWPVVLESLPGIATFALTSVIGLLLAGAGVETVVRRDVFLDRELRAAGWSNLLAGLTGGFPGYLYIGASSLNHRIGARSRVAPALAAGVCALTLVLGTELLGLLPRMVAAVLLFFMGLDLLYTWLIASVRRLGRADYAVVLTVFVFVVVVGFMEGVLVGLLLGIALFAFNYSRIDVVKRALTAKDLRSRAARTASAVRELGRHGESIPIYRLEGFIFFGTVNRLLQRIRERAESGEAPLFAVILDFRAVRGLDSSAAMYFSRLPELAQRRGFHLVLSSVPAPQWYSLAREGVRLERRRAPHDEVDGRDPEQGPERRRAGADADPLPRVRTFESLDSALEWSEERLLAHVGYDPAAATVRGLQDQQWALFTDPALSKRFLALGERRDFLPGEALTRQGDHFHQLHFVLSGTVDVVVNSGQGEKVRLRSMGPGSSVGEISLYLGGRATADVVARTPTVTLSFSRERLDRMEKEAPELHARLHQALAHTLASRLADSTRLVDMLLH